MLESRMSRMFGYDNSVSISQIYKSTRLWNRYNLASFIVRNAAHTVPFWRPLAYRYLYPQYFENSTLSYGSKLI
jgi:hypothetical protein